MTNKGDLWLDVYLPITFKEGRPGDCFALTGTVIGANKVADCKSRSMWYKAQDFMTSCKELMKFNPSGKDYDPETSKSWTATRTWPCLTSQGFFAEILNWPSVREKANSWKYFNYTFALSLCVSVDVCQGLKSVKSSKASLYQQLLSESRIHALKCFIKSCFHPAQCYQSEHWELWELCGMKKFAMK